MLPTNINDVIFSSNGDKLLMSSIINGSIAFPSDAIKAMLLYGRYGTGKTTLALMIPTFLELLSASEQELLEYDWCYSYIGKNISVTPNNKGKTKISPQSLLYLNCGEINKATAGMFDILNSFIKRYLGNICPASSKVHIILDEIDCLDKHQQDKLKGFVTSTPSFVVFYMTTNNIQQVNKGLQSRSHLLLMDGINANNKELYIEILRKEFKHLNKYTNAQLEKWLSSTEGDWRDIEKGVFRL